MNCQNVNSFRFDVILLFLLLGKFLKASDSEILASDQDSVDCCSVLWYGNRARLRTDNILHWRLLQCDTRSLHNRSIIVCRYSSAPTFTARVTHFIGTTIHRFYALPMGILEFLFFEKLLDGKPFYICLLVLLFYLWVPVLFFIYVSWSKKVNLNHAEDHNHKIPLN
jgi:hypothetical protein